jgi:hypothetical protein
MPSLNHNRHTLGNPLFVLPSTVIQTVASAVAWRRPTIPPIPTLQLQGNLAGKKAFTVSNLSAIGCACALERSPSRPCRAHAQMNKRKLGCHRKVTGPTRNFSLCLPCAA